MREVYFGFLLRGLQRLGVALVVAQKPDSKVRGQQWMEKCNSQGITP